MINKTNLRKINYSSNTRNEIQENIIGKEEGKLKDYLVIFYGAGDKDFITSQAVEYKVRGFLEKVGSTPNMHLVSIIDLGKFSLNFKGAKSFYITQADNNTEKINSPILKEYNQANLADPNFIANELKEIIMKFAA